MAKTTKKATKKTTAQKLYANNVKQDKKIIQANKKNVQMDNGYDTVSKARQKVNKSIGVTNQIDRVAKTNTAKVYNVNKHYAQAINGTFKNANTMVNGQLAVNKGNYNVTKRKAENEGADANHQNDVRYTQAKHVVAGDSATTRNKLSVNHSQQLNKITTNTASNVAAAKATKLKSDANSREKYYNFKGTTLKNMKLNRITKTQEQKNNDRSQSLSYSSDRQSAKQSMHNAKYSYKQDKKEIAVSNYGDRAAAKYTDLASVNAAIKKMKGSKDKYKVGKLTELYKIKANLTAASAKSSGSSSGSSGRRSSSRRSSYRRYGSSGSGGSGSGRGSGGSATVPGDGDNTKKSGGKKKGGSGSSSLNLYTATQIRDRSIGKGVNALKGGTGREVTWATLNGGGLPKGSGSHKKKGGTKKKKSKGKNKQKLHMLLISR